MQVTIPRLISPWHGLTFPKLAESMARARPDQIAFVDAPDTSHWLYRQARALTYAEFIRLTHRFARQIVTFGLKRGDTVILILPNSHEFAVAFVGALAAGLIPVPLSIAASPDQIRDAADLVNAQAIVTVSRIGEMQPALVMREIAAQVFSIRAIGSFGKDCLEGVASLDGWDEAELDPLDPQRARGSDEISLVTLEFHDGLRAVARTQSQLIAESIGLTSTAHIGPRGCLLNTLMPGSAFGVIACIALPLLVRAQVHFHGVFSSQTLVHQLMSWPGMAIIAPLALESALCELGAKINGPVGTAILLHRAESMATVAAGPTLSGRVVDVNAIGEAGHYFIPRTIAGRKSPLPQNWRQPGTRVVEDDTLLLQAKIGENFELSLRGFGVPSIFGDEPGTAIAAGLKTSLKARPRDGQTFEAYNPGELVGERDAA